MIDTGILRRIVFKTFSPASLGGSNASMFKTAGDFVVKTFIISVNLEVGIIAGVKSSSSLSALLESDTDILILRLIC